MADILIKGMKLTEEGHCFLEIFSDGEVKKWDNFPRKFVDTEAIAIELPPHGRLVDIDKMISDSRKGRDVFPLYIESMDDLADFLETYADLDKTDHTVVVEATT